MNEWIEIPEELLPQFSEAIELGYVPSYAELYVPNSNDSTSTLILVRSEDENTLDRLEVGVTSLLWELLEEIEGR